MIAHEADDCPHPEFEPVKDPPRYAPPMLRCTSCRLLWGVSTEPVQRWMAATGRTVEPEPFE